ADLAGADLSSAAGGDGGSGAALTPGDQTLSINAGGQGRSVLLHVPAAAGPMPLVIALHGNGDTSNNFVAALGLKAKADAAPFVLAAPQGVPSMPMGVPAMVVWDAYTALASNADEALLDAIKAQLGASATVDGKRIFVWGYSQ